MYVLAVLLLVTFSRAQGAPTININNASVAEPDSGSVNMVFTVTLSEPAASTVTVNFQTANGGSNPATAGSDYTPSSGQVVFQPGERLQSIPVPVSADGDNTETDETFLVNLSTPSGAPIGTGQATGTITAANPPGAVVISELRTSGPGGASDDFVELYNNTDSPVDISGWSLVKIAQGACFTQPVIAATVPASTTLAPRAHYLLAGSAYSLAGYGAGDQTLAADIAADSSVALFATADVASFSTGTRRDAVSFGLNVNGNCDLLRERTPLPGASGSTSEHSFARKLALGTPQDTNSSTADFVVISTTPGTAVGDNLAPLLGGPGPENAASPIQRNGIVKASLLDPAVASTAVPNREVSNTPVTNGATGTLAFRRRFTNMTGAPVTRLRFRVVDITTLNSSGSGLADLRAITSADEPAVATTQGPVSTTGLTLEEPPAQALGGGFNSTLSVTLGSALNNGQSINIHFRVGLMQRGAYRFFINVEALTGAAAAPVGKLAPRPTGKLVPR
jgi:hypothetical protein